MTRDGLNSTSSRPVLAAVLAATLAGAPFGFDGAGDVSNSAAAQSADVGADVGAELGGGGAEVGASVGGADVGAGVGADLGGGDDTGGDGGGGDSGGNESDGGDDGGNADGDNGAGVGADAGTGGTESDGGTGGQAGAGDNGVAAGNAANSEAAATPADTSTVGVDDNDNGRPPFRRAAPHPYRYFASINLETTAFQYYRDAAERNDLPAAGEALADATDRPVTVGLVQYVNAELEVETHLTAPQIAAAANNHPFPEHAGQVGSAAAEERLATQPEQ